MRKYILFFAAFVLPGNLTAQKPVSSTAAAIKSQASEAIESGYEQYQQLALKIWDFAEVGYKETRSSGLLQQTLADNGFTVEAGIAGMPTAFVATYGSGKPVIAILAEYDALPGISQTADPEKRSAGKEAGHACGHHLFGVASVASGVAIKKLVQAKQLTGTIKVFGCPAEEGGSGKVYLVRDGFFKDVDIAIHWHPGDKNEVTTTSALANISAKFRFYGLSAHAAASPERGRSALDGVEAMDNMVNMMREHVPQETRIHYVITNGGKAPNVVPDFAEVYYYVRHPKRDMAKAVFDRVVNAAKGAALGTDTRVDYELIGGTHDLLINQTLAAVMQQNLERTGGVSYTTSEKAFAGKIQSTFTSPVAAADAAALINPLKLVTVAGGGSTDVGDVSYTVPTVGLEAATWVPGTAAHSWQAIAAGGTSIGTKGMMVAAKTMACTAIDLFLDASIIQQATNEFLKARGTYEYKALLGDRKPALNYRD